MTAIAAPKSSSTATDDAGFQVLPTPHSSYIAAFRYNKKTLRLEVTFKFGGIKSHYPIYEQTWLDLQAAPSMGRYYTQAIARTNPGEKIK